MTEPKFRVGQRVAYGRYEKKIESKISKSYNAYLLEDSNSVFDEDQLEALPKKKTKEEQVLDIFQKHHQKHASAEQYRIAVARDILEVFNAKD